MTKVAILPERSAQGLVEYRAIAGRCQAIAGTAGAALDAVAAQLPASEAGTLVIVQHQRADPFFTAHRCEVGMNTSPSNEAPARCSA